MLQKVNALCLPNTTSGRISVYILQHKHILIDIFCFFLDFMLILHILLAWLSETQSSILKGEIMAKPCKHKFQPRYDCKWTTVMEELQNSKAAGEIRGGYRIAEPYMKEKTYIYDICVKCGQTIKRS